MEVKLILQSHKFDIPLANMGYWLFDSATGVNSMIVGLTRQYTCFLRQLSDKFSQFHFGNIYIYEWHR